jgi:hypothetical protein
MFALREVSVRAIAIDEPTNSLFVLPGIATGVDYQYIYRAESGVRWDASHEAFHACEPQKWTHGDLLKQIRVSVASEYGDLLVAGSETRWGIQDERLCQELRKAASENITLANQGT